MKHPDNLVLLFTLVTACAQAAPSSEPAPAQAAQVVARAPATAEAPEPADGALERRQLDAALAAAVARLPPALGELYHLRTSGLSYEEIAGVVDAPLGTVKSRMHQMVHALREELLPWTAPE